MEELAPLRRSGYGELSDGQGGRRKAGFPSGLDNTWLVGYRRHGVRSVPRDGHSRGSETGRSGFNPPAAMALGKDAESTGRPPALFFFSVREEMRKGSQGSQTDSNSR